MFCLAIASIVCYYYFGTAVRGSAPFSTQITTAWDGIVNSHKTFLMNRAGDCPQREREQDLFDSVQEIYNFAIKQDVL